MLWLLERFFWQVSSAGLAAWGLVQLAGIFLGAMADAIENHVSR